MGEEYEGLNVEASAIAAMPVDRRFAVILAAPVYEQLPDFKDKEKTQRKLVIQVELSNGSKARYIPNKKSADFIAGRVGTDFLLWISKKITWEAVKQSVAGNMKDCLYVVKVE